MIDSMTGKAVEVPDPVIDSVRGLPPPMSDEEAAQVLAGEEEWPEDPGV